MHYSDIYKTIKLRRDDLKISQEQVSKLSGVGLRTLKQLESGKGNPNIKTLQN
ncbi:MAG: helix-turn-helix transcriptional regulator, partial [Bacteroidales bacterium]|nr:helix-turn-helix transcriptional regulator [Bacteroidales bacterium]